MAAQPSLSLCDAPELQPYIVKDVEQTGKELGRGSYGVVLEVKVEGAICAAKKLHNLLVQSDNEGYQVLVQKFVKEIDLLKQLRHPRIVQYMGLAFLPGTALPLLLMERLDITLDDTIEAKGKFPISMKRSILVDVAGALVYLHGHNPPIIHRDLTAKNVLLTRAMEAKLADLGNAFLIDPSRLSQTMSKIPGTMSYMPPEAFDYKPHYTSKLDIFSFGHLSLYLFTETFPGDLQQPTYYNEKSVHIARTEVERRQIYVDKLTTELGRDNHPLAILVRECLHNLPDRRPTAKELHERLMALQFTEMNDPLSQYVAMSHYDFVQTICRLKEPQPQTDKVALLPKSSSFLGIKTQKFRVLKIVDGHTLRILSSDQRSVKKEIPLCNITQVVPEKSSQKENFPFTIHFSTSEGDSKNMRYDATSEEERNEWIRLLKTPAAIYEVTDIQEEYQELGKTYSPLPPPLPAARTQPPLPQAYSSPHSKNHVSTPGDSRSSLQQPTSVELYEGLDLYAEMYYEETPTYVLQAPNPSMPQRDSHLKKESSTEPYLSESGPEEMYEAIQPVTVGVVPEDKPQIEPTAYMRVSILPNNSDNLADTCRTDEMRSSAENLSQEGDEYEEIPLHYDPLHQLQLTKHPGKVKDESPHDTAADISQMQQFREGKETESTCRESLSQEQESDLYDVPKKTGRDDTYDYAQVPTPELQQRSKQKKKRRSKFKKRDSHLSVHNPVKVLLPIIPKDMTDEVQGQSEYVNIPIDRPPLPIPQQTKQQEGSKDKINAVLTPPVTPQPKPRQHQNPTPQGRSLNDDEPKANSTSREEPTLDDTSPDYDYARFSALEIQRQPKDTKKRAHDPIEASQIENGSYVSLTDKSLLVYDTPREFFSTLLKKSSNT